MLYRYSKAAKDGYLPARLALAMMKWAAAVSPAEKAGAKEMLIANVANGCQKSKDVLKTIGILENWAPIHGDELTKHPTRPKTVFTPVQGMPSPVANTHPEVPSDPDSVIIDDEWVMPSPRPYSPTEPSPYSPILN